MGAIHSLLDSLRNDLARARQERARQLAELRDGRPVPQSALDATRLRIKMLESSLQRAHRLGRKAA